MPKLYAVAKDKKPNAQEAREAVQSYRERQNMGLMVGERLNHRAWPEGIVRAFLGVEIIRPVRRLTQRDIDGRKAVAG